MSSAARSIARLFFCVLGTALPFAASAQIDVTTERYDDARLGANLQETQLTTANINVDSFGKLWSYTVSGSVYAQPLYVHDLAIPGQGTHDVLFVATMNDMLYAFDADASQDAPLYSIDLASEVPGEFVVCVDDALGFNDNIIGNIGIESTPVIDLATNTIYVVVRTETSDSGACHGANRTYIQRLHALDMTTFEEKPGSPVVIGGSVPGNGSGSVDGVITFDARIADQRSSLALSNGRLFIAWSGHSDQFAYHGWVMGYDAATLQQTMIWSSAPDGSSFNGAGIWMAGRAPTIDADGNVYYTTGNGTWDGTTNFGESFVKFGPTPDAPLLDWFTPDNVQHLNDVDLDLGGSGPILVPGTDLIVSGGKGGVFYVTHVGNLGHRMTDDIGIVQSFDNSNPAGSNDQIKGGPVYWNRDGGLGPWMYVWSDGHNSFNAYRFNGATFDVGPVSQSTLLSPNGSAGGVLTLSANGSTPGSGIVWSSMALEDANSNVHPGVLRAFDADNLGTELWNSEQDHARDDAGNWPKFAPPTVVNGRVYLGSFPSDGIGDTHVSVYGLLVPPPGDFTVNATLANPGVNPGGEVSYTVDIEPSNGFAEAVHLDIGALPDGVTATFAANDLTPPAQTTLTLDVAASVAPGEYLFDIVANSGSLSHDSANGFYVTTAAPGAGVISVDFTAIDAGPDTALAPIDVAGVTARPNWNEAAGMSTTGQSLLDESSADTGATIDFATDEDVQLGLTGSSPDDRMMNTAFDAHAPNTTVITVHDLPAVAGGHFIYIYADGANAGASASGTYTLVGDDGDTASAIIVDAPFATFSGEFIRADAGNGHVGNYAVLFTASRGFTLTATASSDSPPDSAPLNGMQIVDGDRIFGDGFDG